MRSAGGPHGDGRGFGGDGRIGQGGDGSNVAVECAQGSAVLIVGREGARDPLDEARVLGIAPGDPEVGRDGVEGEAGGKR